MKRILPVVHGLLLAVALGFGQNPAPDSLLTWPDCVALALHNNPELASSKSSLEAARTSYYESRNGLFPQLSLNQSFSSSSKASNSSTSQTGASLNLNLFNMPEITTIQTSKSLISQAEANQRQASSLLRFNLRKAFAQLLFVEKSIEVSRKIVDMRQEESQLVTLRYNSGRESKGNMLRASAQLLQAKADLSQAIRDLRTDQRNLNRQLGLQEFTAFKAGGTLDAPSLPDLPSDEDALLGHRPDIILLEAVVNTQETVLRQAKSSYWPDLTASYSQFVDGFSSLDHSWNLLLSYPLFGRGPTATHYAILTAKNNLEKARQDLRSAREQAKVDLETSWSDFAGAYDQTKVQTALLEAARQRNDEANIRYDSGLMAYDNWEIIVSDRVGLERQAIQAQLNAVVAHAALEKALGKQLEE
jgi:outer membrane protein TolC